METSLFNIQSAKSQVSRGQHVPAGTLSDANEPCFLTQKNPISDTKEPYFKVLVSVWRATRAYKTYSCQYYVSLKKSALQSCHILNFVAGRTSQNRISRGSRINRVDDYEQNNALQFCCISNLVAGGPWRNSICWHVLYPSTQQEQGFCAWM